MYFEYHFNLTHLFRSLISHLCAVANVKPMELNSSHDLVNSFAIKKMNSHYVALTTSWNFV